MTRLTATRVAALKAEDTARDISDPEMRGLVLRVSPTGSKLWLFRYKHRGHANRISLGAHPGVTLHEARSRAKAHRDHLEQGIDPATARAPRRAPAVPVEANGHKPYSIEFLASEFMQRHIRPNRKQPDYVQRLLDVDVVPTWKGRDARTIKAREVVELLDGITARGSKVMANRVAAVLGQMFRFGIHRSIVEDSPVKLLFLPGGKEKPRQRTLSDAELGALLATADDTFHRAPKTASAVRLFLWTAVRRSELALAHWSEFKLDDDEPTWTLPSARTKTEASLVIPLVPAAVTELKHLKRAAGRSRYVFPGASEEGPADPKLITRSLARHEDALKKLSIKAFTVHDLRRTARTGLGRLGVAPHIAERCLGHAQPGLITTYDTHDYITERREALMKWARHLEALPHA